MRGGASPSHGSRDEALEVGERVRCQLWMARVIECSEERSWTAGRSSFGLRLWQLTHGGLHLYRPGARRDRMWGWDGRWKRYDKVHDETNTRKIVWELKERMIDARLKAERVRLCRAVGRVGGKRANQGRLALGQGDLSRIAWPDLRAARALSPARWLTQGWWVKGCGMEACREVIAMSRELENSQITTCPTCHGEGMGHRCSGTGHDPASGHGGHCQRCDGKGVVRREGVQGVRI